VKQSVLQILLLQLQSREVKGLDSKM